MARIIGTSGNNTLTGTNNDDFISGLAGNDILSGLGGNDTLIGGAGTDTAKFSGAYAGYTITPGLVGGGFKISDTKGGNGTDLSSGNETLQFSDATVKVTWLNLPDAEVVPDPDGPYSSSQSVREIVGLPDGGFLLGYYSPGSYRLQAFDASGGKTGEAQPVLGDSVSDIYVKSSGYLTASSYGTIQQFDASGVLQAQWWDYPHPDNAARNFQVAGLPDGRVVNTWVDDSGILHGQLLSAGGYPSQTHEFWQGNAQQYSNDTAALINGNFVITYAEPSGSAADVLVFNSAGTLIQTTYLPYDNTNRPIGDTHVIPLAGGGFAVAWEFSFLEYPGSSGSYIQRFDTSGHKVGAAIFDYGSADLSPMQDGGFIVGYESLIDEIGYAGEVVRYDASGRVSFTLDANKFGLDGVSVTALADGGFAVAYSPWALTDSDAIYAARYSAFNNKQSAPSLTITGDGSSQNLSGLGWADTINAGAGNDVIDGKEGADTMAGGTGSDVYYVENAKDVVTEKAGEGTDEVRSALDYTLPTNVENLTLLGVAANGTGNAEANTIIGNYAANILSGLGGNDVFVPLGGDDTINGGAGTDGVSFAGWVRDYHFTDNGGGKITVSGPEGTDTLTNVEQLGFVNMSLSIADRSKFDPIFYLEQNRDVANANVDPLNHYMANGWAEGRDPDPNVHLASFDGLEYIASYNDLIKAFGANPTAGKAHFATAGLFEGRSATFDGLEYIASYGDLIQAFHFDVAKSAHPEDIGASHYILAGHAEGRVPDHFNAAQYIANYADLSAFFGTNYEAATLHYVLSGCFEGRTDHVLS